MLKKIKLLAVGACICMSAGVLSATPKSSVTADDVTPQLDVYATNLTFAESVYIKYAINAENVLPTDEYGMLVWLTPQEEYVYGAQNTVLESTETTTVQGVKCDVFAYTDLAAKQMTDTVYARAYVERDGEYYYSEVKKYSVLEYAYGRFGKTEASPTTNAALKILLQGMLAYGAAAQTYFTYKTDRLATDDFTYVRVANATFADGFDYGLYKVGEEIEITPADGYQLDLEHADYLTETEDGKIILTVPEEKLVDEESVLEKEVYSEGLAYSLNSDNASYTVTGIGTCTDTDLIIPSTYNGLPVTAIGRNAFVGEDFVKITLGKYITNIDYQAFNGCKSLIEIVMGDSLMNIGSYVFTGCTSLKDVHFMGKLEDWCKIAFKNEYANPMSCAENLYIGNQLLTKLVIPDTITEVKDYAFCGMDCLSEVFIHDNVTILGKYQFKDCINLISVAIGNSVASIAEYTFNGCTSLTNVIIGDGVTNIGVVAFAKCQSLMNITFGENSQLLSIADSAFAKCMSLTDIVIPYSVEIIGKNVFRECSSLTKIAIPDSVISIGDSAFYGCSGLTSVVFNENSRLTNIGSSVFSGCKSLTKIEIPNSVASIGSSAFYGCWDLVEIVFDQDSQLTSIDNSAFHWCRSLIEIVVPENVTEIGANAFNVCDSLTSVTFRGNSKLTSIGNNAFSNCSSLVSVVIPDSVTSIGGEAFAWCSNLTDVYYFGGIEDWCEIIFGDSSSNPMYEGDNFYINNQLVTEVTIPETITEIKDSTFCGMKCLTKIVIPDSVTSIGDNAFSRCSSLTSIVIPDSVMSIGDSAFYYCSGLVDVTISDSVTSIGYETFSYCSSLIEIVIPDSVTSIGDYAFSMCTNLMDVTFGGNSKLTSVGINTFSECRRLTTIVIPDNVMSVGNGAFQECCRLVEVYNKSNLWIANGDYGLDYVKNIYTNEDGSKLTTDEIGFVIYDGNCLIDYIGEMTEITIPNGITAINDYAFNKLDTFTKVTISAGVTSIGRAAFGACGELRSVKFDENSRLLEIGDSAFGGCGKLTKILIPDNVISIGEYAFFWCDMLDTVYYKGTIEEWKDIKIRSYNSELINAKRYYYSEEEPTADGNYWHYVDGEVVVWTKIEE